MRLTEIRNQRPMIGTHPKRTTQQHVLEVPQAICNRQHLPIHRTVPLFRFLQLAAKVRDGMIP